MNSAENRPEQPSIADRYRSKADAKGYVQVGDFATPEFQKQAKSIAAFLDGDGDPKAETNLGTGLRYTGDSGNYSGMRLHIGDLDEFVRRVREYYASF